jgi:endonuclease/exonuclease/phosphatase family metal-dependent hydrolase
MRQHGKNRSQTSPASGMAKASRRLKESSMKMAERAVASGKKLRERAQASRQHLQNRSCARHARTQRQQQRKAALAVSMPYLGLIRGPVEPTRHRIMGREIRVASYNVHRWSGINGRKIDPERARCVIAELDADAIALQEVLRPFDAEDPLILLADALHMHVVFSATRIHRHGELGNAILARWPAQSAESLNLSLTRHERRSAIAVRYQSTSNTICVVATHLALVDRTRSRQVHLLLEHPRLQSGPVVLLGDMNAWRPTRATRDFERALGAHNNQAWPRTFPATAPLFSLDRIYTRGARLLDLQVHDTPAARKGSDHLPVTARLVLV